MSLSVEKIYHIIVSSSKRLISVKNDYRSHFLILKNVNFTAQIILSKFKQMMNDYIVQADYYYLNKHDDDGWGFLSSFLYTICLYRFQRFQFLSSCVIPRSQEKRNGMHAAFHGKTSPFPVLKVRRLSFIVDPTRRHNVFFIECQLN